MKQSLAYRLATLLVSVVVTAVLLESVAQLAYPVSGSHAEAAQTAIAATSPKLSTDHGT